MSARGRPSLQRVLVVAIGGLGVLAVLVTAGLTLGLLRLTAERTTLGELERDAARLIRLTGPLERCPVGPRGRLPREGVRLLPAGAATLGFEEIDVPGSGRASVAGTEVLYVARPVECGGRSATLVLFRPATEIPFVPAGAGGRVAAAAGVAVGASALVAWVLARRLARPLGELAEAARDVARRGATDPAEALGSRPEPLEVEQLRDAFVDMSRDLRDAREHEKAFLLSVSHELKTPLTAIRGYGEALADGTARAATQAGEVVVRESRRLERLVQDLIDLARIEAGEFSVEAAPTDLGDAAVSVVEGLQPAARDAGVSLQARPADGASVRTDPDRLHQMLANLVENALRVTPDGGRVVVTVGDREIVVEDSGPGLTDDDVAHAFDRFHLWRRYRGQRPVGTGLGLAIVGELATLLDVRIDIDSVPERGTRFILRFDA